MSLFKVVETIKKYYRIHRSKIAFFKFILEGYDGLAMLTTINPERGEVLIRVAPGREAEVDTIVEELKKNMMIESVIKPELIPD